MTSCTSGVGFPTEVSAPTSAAIEKGFYKEVGIDLKTTTGRGSGDAVKKVAGGGAMFGDGDMSAVMVARVKEGAPVKCLMYWHDHSPHALFTLESSGIKNFKDLAGKTLATTPGNSHRNYFPITAKMAGLDPEFCEVDDGRCDDHAFAACEQEGRCGPLFHLERRLRPAAGGGHG